MHSRDELRRRGEKAGGVARSAPAPEAPVTWLVGLQQSVGNAAVAGLMQRAPRERPASTDAPGRRPAAKPARNRAKMKDIRGRVIHVSVERGMTRIAISAGPDQGVEEGMAGYLAGADGKSYEDFEIDKIRGRASIAYVRATVDQVTRNPDAVITPSSGGSPRVEDQQF